MTRTPTLAHEVLNIFCINGGCLKWIYLPPTTSFLSTTGRFKTRSFWQICHGSVYWSGLHFWTYPPLALMRAMLSKINSEGAYIILIAASWANQSWYPEIFNVVVVVPLLVLPLWKRLLKRNLISCGSTANRRLLIFMPGDHISIPPI